MTNVTALTPYAHVADVERSLAFYAKLGLAPTGDTFEHEGVTVWASAGEAPARIMLSRASERVRPEQQAVLFYLYSPDVAALRAGLLASGVVDAPWDAENPARCSAPWRALAQGIVEPRGLVSGVQRPFYMPEGEIRIADPDGYILLIGQTG
jgi:hypothetical protein